MLTSSTFAFLENLKTHNDRIWFEENKNSYLEAKQNVEFYAEQLIALFGKTDISLAYLTAKDTTFRIFRDVRFGKNKDPYKTNMAIYLGKDGRKAVDIAGYYTHLEPGNCYIAAGLWQPSSSALQKIRQEIDYNLLEFERILQNPELKQKFSGLNSNHDSVLQRPPKGYEASHPGIQYLKHKSFIVSCKVPDTFHTSKNSVSDLASIFSTTKPFVDFLIDAVA